MAIYHFTTKPISRGKGQSAIAAAAYRSGERLRDEHANEVKHYKARAERIEFEGIYAPSGAPEWAQDRNRLWNEAERAETRKDARLAREIEVGLPHELTAEQRRWLVQDFVREQFVRKGYAVDVAIHAPDKGDARNYHAHILIAERRFEAEGFAPMKDPAMNKREQLGAWREQWAHLANRHLERHGHAERIDHRSLKAQGIDREAGVHLGYAPIEMDKRGAQSDRMDALKDIMERNDIRLELAALDGQVQALQQQSLAKARDMARNAEGLERAAALRQLGNAAKADARKLWEPPQGQVSAERIFGDTVRRAAQQERVDRREKAFWAEQEAWRVSVQEQKPAEVKPVEPGLQVVDKATGAAMGLADFVSNALAGSSATPEPPERKPNMGAYVSDPAARKEQQLARVAAARRESEAEKAIQRLYDDIDQGRALSASDMHHLNRAQLEVIRMKGDDGMRQIVEAAHKRDETYWKTKDGHERDGKYRHDSGRERERD